LVDGREPFIIQGQSAGAEPGNLHTSNFVTVAMQTTGSPKAETSQPFCSSALRPESDLGAEFP
jgi:hypothetical protein